MTNPTKDGGDCVSHVVNDARRPATLDQARALLSEAGVARARRELHVAVEAIESAQHVLRLAQEAERNAADALDAATADVDAALDRRFVIEGNRTWLLTERGDKDRTLTADERARWREREARKIPAVARAAHALRRAEQETASAQDGLALAERVFSARRADLAAAVSVVETLRLALSVEA